MAMNQSDVKLLTESIALMCKAESMLRAAEALKGSPEIIANFEKSRDQSKNLLEETIRKLFSFSRLGL